MTSKLSKSDVKVPDEYTPNALLRGHSIALVSHTELVELSVSFVISVHLCLIYFSFRCVPPCASRHSRQCRSNNINIVNRQFWLEHSRPCMFYVYSDNDFIKCSAIVKRDRTNIVVTNPLGYGRGYNISFRKGMCYRDFLWWGQK